MNGTSKELVGVLKDSTSISSIYQGITLVWCKNSLPNFNEEDVVFEVDTSYSKTVYLPISGATNTNLGSVDWGDGTVEDVIITMPSFTRIPMKHTYSDSSTYIITFIPNGQSFDISDSYSTDSLAFTKVYSFGTKYPTTVSFTKNNHFSYFQKNYPFKNDKCTIANIQQDNSINLEGLFGGMSEGIDGYISGTFTKIEGDFLGANITAHNLDEGVISNCPNLVEIDTINIPNETVNNICAECPSIKVIKSVTYPTNPNSYSAKIVLFGNKTLPSIRELTITNLGDYKGYSLIDFRDLTYWGINSTPYNKAKKSLVDSLITNTTDKSGEAKALSIYLSTNTKNALTSAEKAQITAKGYTIA